MTAYDATQQLDRSRSLLLTLQGTLEGLRDTSAYDAGVQTYLHLAGQQQFLEGALRGASPSDFYQMGRTEGFGIWPLVIGGAALSLVSAGVGGMIGKHVGEAEAATQYYTCLDRQYSEGASMADAAKVCGIPLSRTGTLDALAGVIKWGTMLVVAVGGIYVAKALFAKPVAGATS